MHTELQVKSTGTESSKTRLSPNLIRQIYVSLFANALVFKAGAITGLRFMDCGQKDLDAVLLLEAGVMLLKMEPSLTHTNAAGLESFAEHVQARVMDSVQSDKVNESFDTGALYKEIAHCRQLATQECQYITGQMVDNDLLPFEFSDLAKRAFVSQESMALLSLNVQLKAAQTFMLNAVNLFTEVLIGIQATESTTSSTCYQTYKSYVPLLFVANSFYDIAPEIEISSLESLEEFLDAIRFQFPVLDRNSCEEDERCIDFLEKCLNYARAAGSELLLKTTGQ